MAVNYQDTEANEHFQRVFQRGKRNTSSFRKMLKSSKELLSLEELTGIAKPQGGSLVGSMEISVHKIIGSEDRSGDFAQGFLPTKPWMKSRWIKVCLLMMEGNLEEPIDVLEYGGVYFVRDGHHRVSVSKKLKREFLRARVTKLQVPFTLPETFSRRDLPNFKRMAKFQERTDFFTLVPEAWFGFKRQKSWDILEKEIACWSPSWFERHDEFKSNPDLKEQHQIWYYWLIHTVLGAIKKISLHYLYPGWSDMDVAMEIIAVWNSYPNPDDISIEELYSSFLNQTRRRRFILAPVHLLAERWNSMTRTARDERKFFYERSYIQDIYPEFRLPADLGKRFWRNLYKDVFYTHYRRMKKNLGRQPYFEELLTDWYEKVWLKRTEL